ncbi:MAG: metallothiol transferase FosB [Firmicutes bacterium]|nr:metallothiol transferase FosB [Bacillota bacterium]
MRGLNHITFAVSNMDRALEFYTRALGAKLLCRADKTCYLDLGGIWLALNCGPVTPPQGYTHLAFSIDDADFQTWREHLLSLGVELRSDRERHEAEGKSLYFTDPDGHLLELHTKNRAQRVDYYRRTRTDMEFY